MKVGNYIRKAFNLYLENPVLLIPFFILGIIEAVMDVFTKGFLKGGLSTTSVGGIEMLMISDSITSSMAEVLMTYGVLIFATMVFMAFLNSFAEAYAIGLSKKMFSSKRRVKIKDGLKAIDLGMTIFQMKLIVLGLMITGAFAIVLPAVMLFGRTGILISIIVLIIYVIALLLVSFFAGQSIVLEKNKPWDSIVSSYGFIKRNIEGVVLVILFNFLIILCFTIITKVWVSMGQYILSGFGLDIMSYGIGLILFSLIAAPYFVVLKTIYFMKKPE